MINGQCTLFAVIIKLDVGLTILVQASRRKENGHAITVSLLGQAHTSTYLGEGAAVDGPFAAYPYPCMLERVKNRTD